MATVSQDALTVKHLRQAIGIVGMAMPLVLTIGNALVVGKPVLLHSISDAYYTQMRDVFVGSMVAVGVFLISYRYSRLDDILSTIAGIAAIGTAVFPVSRGQRELMIDSASTTAGKLHGLFAGVLFLSLAAFCFFIFPRSIHPGAMSARKKARNFTYYLCGVIILVGLGLAALGNRLLPDSVVATVQPMFWGETAAIIAFGVAWFAKSNTLFPDLES